MPRPRKTKKEVTEESKVVESIGGNSVEKVSVKEVAQESVNKILNLKNISIIPTESSYRFAKISDLYVGAVIESRALHGNSWMVTEITEEYFENRFGTCAFMSIIKNLKQSSNFYRIKRIDDVDMSTLGFSKEKTGVYTRLNCTVIIDLNKKSRNTQVYIDNECIFNGFVDTYAEMKKLLKQLL